MLEIRCQFDYVKEWVIFGDGWTDVKLLRGIHALTRFGTARYTAANQLSLEHVAKLGIGIQN